MSTSETTSAQVAKNSLFIILGKGVIFLISFGLVTVFSNTQSPETLGSYNYIVSILAIASITTLQGMPAALARSVSQGKEGNVHSMTKKRLLYGAIGTFSILCVGAYYLSKGNAQLGYAFMIAAPFVPLTDVFIDMTFAFWQGRNNFSKASISLVVYQALASLPSLLILFFTKNLEYIILFFMIFQTIGGIVLYVRVKPRNDLRDEDASYFGMHLTAVNILRGISAQVDRIIVWQLFGPALLASYTLATIPIQKVQQIIPIEQLSLPILSKQSLTPGTKKLLVQKMLLIFLALLPILILLYLAAPFLYHTFFPLYKNSLPLFRILLLSLLFSPFLLLETGFTAWRKSRQLYTTEILFLFIKTFCAIFFGLKFGVIGVAGGVVLANLLDSIFTYGLFIFI